MPITYDPWLVLASIATAVLASFVALDMASRLAATRGSREAPYWAVGGAVAMGIGIWSMHFIGMLAAKFPMAMSYDLSTTLLSLAIAVLVSGFALSSVSQETLSRARLGLGGVLMGLGIAGMHYSGMAAMQMQPAIRYDPTLFALSILVAVVASIAALWICFQLRSETVVSAFRRKSASALVMGAAIAGMHYTGMAAVIVAPGSISTVAPQHIHNGWLGTSLAAFTLVLLLIALGLSWLHARSAERELSNERVRISEARFRAILRNSHEAFVAMDADGKITEWNEEAFIAFGWTREEALGHDLAELIIPERFRKAHRTGLARYLATSKGPVIGKRLEVEALHRDGRQFPVELTIDTTASVHPPEFFAFLHDISLRVEVNRKLVLLAHTDVLTDLPNRILFHERLEQAIARTCRSRRPMALMYLDIDHFKRVNDRLGHAAGDELLKHFATRVKSIIREVDTVARLGGDEFAIVAGDLNGSEDAALIASKIVCAVASGFEIGGNLLPVTTSIGVAVYRGQVINGDALLNQADQALYQAKRAGRNTFEMVEFDKDAAASVASAGASLEPTRSWGDR